MHVRTCASVILCVCVSRRRSGRKHTGFKGLKCVPASWSLSPSCPCHLNSKDCESHPGFLKQISGSALEGVIRSQPKVGSERWECPQACNTCEGGRGPGWGTCFWKTYNQNSNVTRPTLMPLPRVQVGWRLGRAPTSGRRSRL